MTTKEKKIEFFRLLNFAEKYKFHLKVWWPNIYNTSSNSNIVLLSEKRDGTGFFDDYKGRVEFGWYYEKEPHIKYLQTNLTEFSEYLSKKFDYCEKEFIISQFFTALVIRKTLRKLPKTICIDDKSEGRKKIYSNLESQKGYLLKYLTNILNYEFFHINKHNIQEVGIEILKYHSNYDSSFSINKLYTRLNHFESPLMEWNPISFDGNELIMFYEPNKNYTNKIFRTLIILNNEDVLKYYPGYINEYFLQNLDFKFSEDIINQRVDELKLLFSDKDDEYKFKNYSFLFFKNTYKKYGSDIKSNDVGFQPIYHLIEKSDYNLFLKYYIEVFFYRTDFYDKKIDIISLAILVIKNKLTTKYSKFDLSKNCSVAYNKREEDNNFYEFVRLLESICKNKYGFESDSYKTQVVEIGEKCLKWIECFIYDIIIAFKEDIPKELVTILSLIVNDEIILKLEEYLENHKEEKFEDTGAIIDTILRNTGKKNPILNYNLFSPNYVFGTTWLNDFNAESILYNHIQEAEKDFAKHYSMAFQDSEDILIMDFFDNYLKTELLNAKNKLNALSNSNLKNGTWNITWNKLKLIEEKNIGCDVALKIKVKVNNLIEFEKISFIQVKKLERYNNKINYKWKIDKKQLSTLIDFSEYSFYLLFIDSDFSNQQRIIPATLLKSLIKQNNTKTTYINDNRISLGSRTFAHFLIYEILAGWQGSQKSKILDWDKKRECEGIGTRYLFELTITKGFEYRDNQSNEYQ